MRLKSILLASIMFLSLQVIAQDEAETLKYGPDKELCEQNLSIYIEFYKQKNYKDAYKPWAYLFNNAPKRTKNIYLHGPKIIKGLIKNLLEEDQERKSVLVDSLIMIYENRNNHYKGQEAYVLGLKGADIYKFKKDSVSGIKESFGVLGEAVRLGGNTTKARILSNYFVASTKLLNAGELTIEDLLDLFSDLSTIISYKEIQLSQNIYKAEQLEAPNSKELKLLKKDKEEQEKLIVAKNNLENALAPYATCEKLVEMYSPNFEKNKGNPKWLTRAAKLLYKKECIDSLIFSKISEALYNLDPTPTAAANNGLLALKQKKFQKAADFYTIAFEGEQDDLNKSKYAYFLAQTYAAMDRNASAKTYALKAASLRSGWGEPYLLIGDLYAKTSRQCGELKTEFLKRVGYWAAIDKYEYVKRLDPQLSAKANARIEKYTEQMPSKTDIFTEGLIDETTYKIDCWYSETVKIRVP